MSDKTYAALHVTCKFRIAHAYGCTERRDCNENELARACLAAEQKERLRDRAWRDAQASSNRDQGNTARKKREAAVETPEEREARLQHIIMRGMLATPGYSKCEAGY